MSVTQQSEKRNLFYALGNMRPYPSFQRTVKGEGGRIARACSATLRLARRARGAGQLAPR